jgi:shikimate dehydrogenase
MRAISPVETGARLVRRCFRAGNPRLYAPNIEPRIPPDMPAAVPHFAVFGHPIAHSLSPRLHALFAAQTGIALEYLAIDAPPVAFADTVRDFFEGNGRGANVTLPHKAAAFALADVHGQIAHRLGVANVLTKLPDGRIEADSNDGAGMLADLQVRCGVDPRERNVLLLGAGGAARAAAFALLDAEIESLVIANRTFERALALAKALSHSRRTCVSRWEELDRCAPFDLIINATSAGVRQAALALPASLAHARTFAYDLSYGEAARPFIDWARGAGCALTSDGLGMLVETAAASFQRWQGVRPDTGAALRALRLPNEW